MSLACRPEGRTGTDGQLLAGPAGVNRRALRLLVQLLFFVLAWGVVSWFLAEKLGQERSLRLIERERELASSSAASVGASVGASLAYMRSIPKVLARQSEVEAALSLVKQDIQHSSSPQRFRSLLEKKPALIRLGKKLESILSDLDVEQILVINAAGDCIASAGFPVDSSPVGENYSDRLYFQKAKQGGVGRQFAVGRTTNLPGIYYSSAVTGEGGFLGVVAVRINVAQLSGMGVDRNTLITDENGVIILSGDAGYYMKAMPGSRVDKISTFVLNGLYQNSAIETLDIQTVEVNGVRLSSLQGREAPMLEAVSHNRTDLLSIHVFQDASGLLRIRDEEKWIFVFLFMAGAVVIAGVLARGAYLQRGKEHQAEIARVNAELVMLNEELIVQARFDALTGCGNRRHFFEELGIELQRAARFDFPCCLALLDIDHFKAVNDLYGHATGDALLTHFSETVRNCLRSSDLLCRIGGEEFALLMPQTALEGGVELAERVRIAVERSSMEGPVAVRVTVSIGVVQWTGNGDSVEAFLARADDVMYAAKHAGRNRVCTESGDGTDLST